MNYRTLTTAEQNQIILERLRTVEIDHARVALDLRIGERFGVSEEEKAGLKEHLGRLAEMADVLIEWAAKPEPSLSSNGAKTFADV